MREGGRHVFALQDGFLQLVDPARLQRDTNRLAVLPVTKASAIQSNAVSRSRSTKSRNMTKSASTTNHTHACPVVSRSSWKKQKTQEDTQDATRATAVVTFRGGDYIHLSNMRSTMTTRRSSIFTSSDFDSWPLTRSRMYSSMHLAVGANNPTRSYRSVKPQTTT